MRKIMPGFSPRHHLFHSYLHKLYGVVVSILDIEHQKNEQRLAQF